MPIIPQDRHAKIRRTLEFIEPGASRCLKREAFGLSVLGIVAKGFSVILPYGSLFEMARQPQAQFNSDNTIEDISYQGSHPEQQANLTETTTC